MDREKLHLLNMTDATGFQGLEPLPSKPSNDWKAPRGLAWLAAFVATFCASAFVVVARCLLRQSGEDFPLLLAVGGFLAGLPTALLLLRLPNIWNLSSACWLAVAGAFASAWGFKLLGAGLLPLAVLPFAFAFGALFCSLALRIPSAVALVLVGWFVAQTVIRLLIPEAGYTASFYALAAALGVTFLIVAALMRVRVLWLLAGVVILGVAAFTAPTDLSRMTAPDGWTIVRRREGVDAAVTLIQQQVKPGQPMLQRLILDNRHIIAGQLGFGEKRLGHLPLLMQPAAKSVLFLHANGGVSMAAARSYPGLEKIDCVEPLAEVAAFLPQFVIPNEEITGEPRAKFIHKDTRSYLAARGATYDVIVANPTPPALKRSQRLLTTEFYADVKKGLTPGGVFMQWLPLYQLDEANLKAIIRTFVSHFSGAQGFIGIYNGELPVFGLFARVGGETPPLEAIHKILHPNSNARAFVADTRDLLGSRLLDSAALVAFAGLGPLHEDNKRALDFPRTGPAQDAKRAGEILRGMILHAPAPAEELALLGEGEGADAMRTAVTARTEAIRRYLLGDILRAEDMRSPDNQELPRQMIAEYLSALDQDPGLPLTRQMLNLQAILRKDLAEPIYRGLLKHSPEDKQLKDLLCDAQGQQAQAVGVPLPPSQCAPGTLAFPKPQAAAKKTFSGVARPGQNTNFFTSARPMPAPPAFPSRK